MFENFQLTYIDTGAANIRVRIGGRGPPLLLLHGNPQTHVMWHRVAPALSQRFTVVAADLTGYGMSSKPPCSPDHEPYSKRAMARDQIAVMRKLGHERFMVAGHDRGARVGYRMALDWPEVVVKLAVLDIVPTGEAFARGGKDFALGYYHWFFLAQASPLPEHLIGADPDWFWRWHTTRGPREVFTPDAVRTIWPVSATRRRSAQSARTTALAQLSTAIMMLPTNSRDVVLDVRCWCYGGSRGGYKHGTTPSPYGVNGPRMWAAAPWNVGTICPRSSLRRRRPSCCRSLAALANAKDESRRAATLACVHAYALLFAFKLTCSNEHVRSRPHLRKAHR